MLFFLLYVHLALLILLLRLCVDMDDILVLCMIDYCMTTSHLPDCMLHVYVRHTCIPFTSKSLVLVDAIPLDCVFGWRLNASCLLFDQASDYVGRLSKAIL